MSSIRQRITDLARFAVGRSNVEPRDTELNPVIFVFYANGGIIAFEDERDTSDHVPVEHLPQIVGAWDEKGQRLELSPDKWNRVEVQLVAEPPDRESLRSTLTRVLQPGLATNLSRLSYPQFISMCHGLLRLKTSSELLVETTSRSGCLVWPFSS